MNGPADRSVRLLLIISGTILAADVVRIVAGMTQDPVAIDDMLVDVNVDPPERLRLLPGIGPAIAGKVIEQREIRAFRGPDDFAGRIRGIGPSFLANFGDRLRFDPSAGNADSVKIDDQVIVP